MYHPYIMAILIKDPETEQYARQIAKEHGRLSKSAAMRLIAAEHQRFSRELNRSNRNSNPAAAQAGAA